MNLNTPARWGELTQSEKRKVEQYINLLLAHRPELPIVERAGREVVTRREGNGVSYQLERVKCGKKGCKCAKGELHGPYWYTYWREGRRVKCKYLGLKWRPFNPALPVDPVGVEYFLPNT